MSSHCLLFVIVLLHLSHAITAQRRPPRDYGIELPETRKINVTQLLATTDRPPNPRQDDTDSTAKVDDIGDRPQEQRPSPDLTTGTRGPQRPNRRPFIEYRKPGTQNDRRPDLESNQRPTARPQGIILFPNQEYSRENQSFSNESPDQTNPLDKYRKRDRIKKVKENQKNKLKGQHDRVGLVRWPAIRVSADEPH